MFRVRHAMGRLKRLPSVIKSPADKKEYRAFKLKNELTVLLVSDLHGADDVEGDDDGAEFEANRGWHFNDKTLLLYNLKSHEKFNGA